MRWLAQGIGLPSEIGVLSQVGVEEGYVPADFEPLISLGPRFFFTYLLPHSAPPSLRPLLDSIVNATGEHCLPSPCPPRLQQAWEQGWPRAAHSPEASLPKVDSSANPRPRPPGIRAQAPQVGWVGAGGSPGARLEPHCTLQESSAGGWTRPWPSWRRCSTCTGAGSTCRTPPRAAKPVSGPCRDSGAGKVGGGSRRVIPLVGEVARPPFETHLE